MDLERLRQRADAHAALADIHRLAIVDELTLADRTPSELAATLGIESNLLAHHLATLEGAGLIERIVSQGDRRRRYIHLLPTCQPVIDQDIRIVAERIVFVCTENAARSQLAESIWNQTRPIKAISAGTRPASRLHPGTIRAAARRGINLKGARPSPLPQLGPHDLVITVCDRAHETLSSGPHVTQLHWSILDPATATTADAYEDSIDALLARIAAATQHILASPA
jgi:ArsR family transcriptional regulator, arsenate/arsenite/antimonite-responsive transcriptional repressor / arsenate reductase (thioredoxin)